MKTIMDVVNYFQAEWPAAGRSTMWMHRVFGGDYLGSIVTDNAIFTRQSFCDLVAELSNWQPTLPKAETVECKGKIYEIGKLYEFSYDSEFNTYEVYKLIGFDSKQSHFETEFSFYANCRELTSDAGTITPAPTKLIDGEAYQFNARGKILNGIYESKHNTLNIMDGQYFNLETCTNITRLVPEVK